MRERRSSRPAAVVSHERWLVSYADFVTLLFAFFVVMFASSRHDVRSISKVSKAIEGGFEAMSANPSSQLPSPFPTSQKKAPAGLPSTQSQIVAHQGPPIDMAALQQQLKAALGNEIAHNEVVIRATPEGFVISLRELGFFNSGEAVLLPGAAGKIKRIADILMQHGLELSVQGHSDNVPIHTAAFKSNWELSTARAMAVLSLLVEESGFNPQKISVAGYGQYRPLGPNDSAEGRRMNRRVDLVVIGLTPAPVGPT
ncbi:MAG TPA: OmpA family protein [Acidisarcina sp.]